LGRLLHFCGAAKAFAVAITICNSSQAHHSGLPSFTRCAGKSFARLIAALNFLLKYQLLLDAIFQRKRTKAASRSVSPFVRTHNVLAALRPPFGTYSSPARALATVCLTFYFTVFSFEK